MKNNSLIKKYTEIPSYLTTPDTVSSRIGELQFIDGYPTRDTAEIISSELDYLHGVETFLNSAKGVSLWAIYKGFLKAGVKDGEVLIFSELMDSRSLFLTANADTVYYMSFIDLSKGPVVFESPPGGLGLIDDMWFRWVTDFGLPGADRDQGGKYLLVPPGYKGSLPDGGFIVRYSKTERVVILGRSFLIDNDPAPTVTIIKENMKIYPYVSGGYGTAIASYLNGDSSEFIPVGESITPKFIEGSEMEINTIMPVDFNYFEMLNELVQSESAEVLDVELAGQFEAIGISKSKKFAPDDRMRKILNEAAIVGNAMSRTLGMGADPRNKFRYYDEKSMWWSPLWDGGYQFINPPPEIIKNKVERCFDSRSRKLNARTSFFYTATGITPSMIMRLQI